MYSATQREMVWLVEQALKLQATWELYPRSAQRTRAFMSMLTHMVQEKIKIKLTEKQFVLLCSLASVAPWLFDTSRETEDVTIPMMVMYRTRAAKLNPWLFTDDSKREYGFWEDIERYKVVSKYRLSRKQVAWVQAMSLKGYKPRVLVG